MMLNTFTKLSEGVSSGVVINEDKTMVMQVVSYSSENQIVTATKVWDEGTSKKNYYAYSRNKVNYFPGQFVIFYRVGAFNSNPAAIPSGFELYIEDFDKTSWLCISASPILMIQCTGESTGVPVIYSGGAFAAVVGAPTLNLVCSAPSGLFYSSIPIEVGRVFFGQRVGDKYLVFLEGMSSEVVEQKGAVAEGTNFTYTIGIDLTSDGRVLDFTGSAVEEEDPVVYEALVVTMRNYDGDDDYNRLLIPDNVTHPYVAFVPNNASGAPYGFRQNADYYMAWQSPLEPTWGDLPSPFTASGTDSVARPKTTPIFKKTATYPTGIIYTSRAITNWELWDPGTSTWVYPYSAQIRLRAMDYRVDAQPSAIRYSNIDTLEMQMILP